MDFAHDVVTGLSQTPRRLSPKYFYDKRGSQLFDQICELPEYYPTRCELEIMSGCAADIGQHLGPQVLLVEYGSGSSVKTRALLDELNDPFGYVPIDISFQHLHDTAERLQQDYPDLDIFPLCADFTEPLELPPEHFDARRTVVYFPGSTIGNFEKADAFRILQQMASQAAPNGGLLIGIDLKKDADVLHAAYNDSQGVTAQFNLNLLRRINRELDGTFRLDGFKHVAEYNADLGRVEMYLESLEDQQASAAGATWSFRRGERICTEYSHKYSIDEFRKMAGEAGFELEFFWTDQLDYFAVLHFCLRTEAPRAK